MDQKYLFLNLLLSLCLIGIAQSAVVMIVYPKNNVYVTEGSEAMAYCYANSSTGEAPKLLFVDNNVIPLKSNIRITITSVSNKPGETNLTIVWRQVLVSDFQNYVLCRRVTSQGGKNVHVNIVVVPKVTVPVITVQPNSSVTAKKYDTVQFTCNASITIAAPVESLELLWTFGGKDINANKLPNNAKASTVNSGSQSISTLVIKEITENNIGLYYCMAVLNIKNRDPSYGVYTKAVNVSSVSFISGLPKENKESEDKYDKEVKMYVGKSVVFDCAVQGTPLPSLTWKKDDDVISNGNNTGNHRYTFSCCDGKNNDTDNPKNKLLHIDDITYSDRAVYKCEISVGGKLYVKKFRLRVRDPLGALWPAIGILIEAVVLAIVIAVYEYHKRSKKEKKGDRTDSADGNHEFKETSPLVSQQPKVSYSSSEGVRARIGSGENA